MSGAYSIAKIFTPGKWYCLHSSSSTQAERVLSVVNKCPLMPYLLIFFTGRQIIPSAIHANAVSAYKATLPDLSTRTQLVQKLSRTYLH